MLASLTHLCYPSKWESNYLRTYRCLAYDNFQFILLEEINCTLKINKLAIIIAPCPQMVIITAPIKGFLPKIKGGNCHIPISQKRINNTFEVFNLITNLWYYSDNRKRFKEPYKYSRVFSSIDSESHIVCGVGKVYWVLNYL